MIAQENFQTTILKTFRILVNETTLTIDHKTTQTTDRSKIVIKLDPVLILELEKTNYQNKFMNLFLVTIPKKFTKYKLKKSKALK